MGIGSPVPTTSTFPFRWWGVHSTLCGIHQLEGRPEPHSRRRKLLTGKRHSTQSCGVTRGRDGRLDSLLAARKEGRGVYRSVPGREYLLIVHGPDESRRGG
jgi:hypothetical protein